MNFVYIKNYSIASGITTKVSFGGIIYYAETICIEESITTIVSYITDNYAMSNLQAIVGGVTYIFSNKKPI